MARVVAHQCVHGRVVGVGGDRRESSAMASSTVGIRFGPGQASRTGAQTTSEPGGPACRRHLDRRLTPVVGAMGLGVDLPDPHGPVGTAAPHRDAPAVAASHGRHLRDPPWCGPRSAGTTGSVVSRYQAITPWWTPATEIGRPSAVVTVATPVIRDRVPTRGDLEGRAERVSRAPWRSCVGCSRRSTSSGHQVPRVRVVRAAGERIC